MSFSEFHPRFQQIAYLGQDSGEYGERRLGHPEEASRFYRSLAGNKVRIGLEAAGSFRWFQRLLAELGEHLGGACQFGLLATASRV